MGETDGTKDLCEPAIEEALQHAQVALLVAGLVDRGLGDEGCVSEALVVEQSAEGLDAHGSLPDVLMPVKLGTARGLGVVAVPHAHRVEARRLRPPAMVSS